MAHPDFSWREWIKLNRTGGEILVLDPACCDHTTPGRVYIWRNDKLVEWRFVGTLDPQKNPLAILGGLAELIPFLSEDSTLLMFEWRHTPLLRQMSLLVGRLYQPTEVLVPAGTALEAEGWSVGAEAVELSRGFPQLVKEAQQRARWIELKERSEVHSLMLGQVAIEGARLGGGRPLAFLEAGDYGEAAGGVLHVVTARKLAPDDVSHLLDMAHASRLSLVSPGAYKGLLCAFSRQGGEDFGLGIIDSFDPALQCLTVFADAVAPAPARIFKLGTLRLTDDGKESEDIKPWTV